MIDERVSKKSEDDFKSMALIVKSMMD
jgi:hypothetical protein